MTLDKKKAAPDTDVEIEYHADDFGLFPAQSQRILDCQEKGCLNGVSVMPNSPFLPSAMARLEGKNMAVTIHLNIIEGRCLCPPRDIPLLVDRDGVFRVGFGQLLLRSFLPGRNTFRAQLRKELRAQITAVAACYPAGTSLRLDGHAHYHMLPVVFDALMDVLREENWPVSYIRIPREYPLLYLRHWRELQDFAPINLAKVLILNLLAWRNQRKYQDYLSKLEQKVFLGVFLSGRMYRENVERVLPDAMALAKKKKQNLELLAHPGGVYEEADTALLTNQQDMAFLTSDARNREADMYRFLKSNVKKPS